MLGVSLATNYKNPIICVSLNNELCQTRPAIVNKKLFFGDTLFYSFTASVKKCGRSCNAIDDLYARVIDNSYAKVTNTNVKVFNLILWIIETRFLV